MFRTPERHRKHHRQDVMRVQAQDVRDLANSELVEQAGKKEIAMKVPNKIGPIILRGASRSLGRPLSLSSSRLLQVAGVSVARGVGYDQARACFTRGLFFRSIQVRRSQCHTRLLVFLKPGYSARQSSYF